MSCILLRLCMEDSRMSNDKYLRTAWCMICARLCKSAIFIKGRTTAEYLVCNSSPTFDRADAPKLFYWMNERMEVVGGLCLHKEAPFQPPTSSFLRIHLAQKSGHPLFKLPLLSPPLFSTLLRMKFLNSGQSLNSSLRFQFAGWSPAMGKAPLLVCQKWKPS